MLIDRIASAPSVISSLGIPLTARANKSIAVEVMNGTVPHPALSRTSRMHTAIMYVTIKIPARRVSIANDTNCNASVQVSLVNCTRRVCTTYLRYRNSAQVRMGHVRTDHGRMGTQRKTKGVDMHPEEQSPGQ